MKDIWFDSYNDFLDKINISRNKMLGTDISIINNKPYEIDINNVDNIPSGHFIINYMGIEFECFFHLKNEEILYIFLNGAQTSGAETRFSRWSYYPFIKGSMLNIADPMLKLFNKLKLGWYYGNEKVNLRIYVAELVAIIAQKLNVPTEKIIFVGSSGGGAAAIECAAHIKDSKAIVINPQIRLREYSYAATFSEITGNNLDYDKKWSRTNGIYYLQRNDVRKYILIFNLRSCDDMKQVDNICREEKIRVKYGLNIFNNYIIWIYDGDMGKYLSAHSTQEFYCIWFFIEHLLENLDNDPVLQDAKDFCSLINEFWYEHWNSEKKWKDRIYNTANVINNIMNKKEVAIWGIGIKAAQLSEVLFDIIGKNYFHVNIAIDNDEKKEGTKFLTLSIKHPSQILNWKEIYIIITSSFYEREIRKQLEGYGLSYFEDFISYRELYN